MSAAFPLRAHPWQAGAWGALVGRVEQGRLPHALLLSGVAGLGKRHLATAFAQYLLCESPHAEGSCGACRSCRLFEAGTHPDFVVIEPEEEGKELTVGQVRGLAAYQALKPQYSERKVLLLTPADRMNVNASNALLKTLEEPTEGTLLLLVTDRPAGLLPTIRSRCQNLALSAPAVDKDLIAWLTKRCNLDEKAAMRLLALAGGAPLRALQLAEEGESARETVLAGLAKTAKGESSPSEVAAEWQKLGADKALRWTYAALCDLVRFCSAGESVNLDLGDVREPLLRTLAKPLDLKSLFRLLDRVQDAGRLLRAHANAQLLLEEVLVHWTALFPRSQLR